MLVMKAFFFSLFFFIDDIDTVSDGSFLISFLQPFSVRPGINI